MTSAEPHPAHTSGAGMHPRWQRVNVAEALETVRVAVLTGARQSGKTTLARTFANDEGAYFNLEDDDVRRAVRDDMKGFVNREVRPMVIDEHQLIPDILYAIKISVDRDQRRGRFLLTGSADILSLPGVRESLAGRAWTVRLRPLAQGEILGNPPSFLHRAFSHTFREREGKLDHLGDPGRNSWRDGYLSLALAGGYPEALEIGQQERRNSWHRRHIDRLLSRDLRNILNIQRKSAMRDLLRILAAWSSKGINLSRIGSDLEISRPTLDTYLNVLETMYVIDRLPSWAGADYTRGRRKDRLFMADSGLLAGTLRWSLKDVRDSGDASGKLIETYVHSQLAALVDVHESGHELFYYRDHDGREVDFVVRNDAGDVLGIEVKSAVSADPEDARHLHWFGENRAKGRSFTGLVLHTGKEVRRLADRVWSAPISCLWE